MKVPSNGIAPFRVQWAELESIGKPGKFLVNARDLYDAASIGTEYSTWIAARLRAHGYEYKSHYILARPVGSDLWDQLEYHLTPEVARAIAENMRGAERRKRALRFLSEVLS